MKSPDRELVAETSHDSDRETFRNSVREFLDRQARPCTEKFIEAHAFPCDIWIEAGEQGLLGLVTPKGTAPPRHVTTGTTPWVRPTRSGGRRGFTTMCSAAASSCRGATDT